MSEEIFFESQEDSVALTYRCAYEINNLIYVGAAKTGSLTSDPMWRIKKRVFSGVNVIAVLYADGNPQFDNVWDNRESYSYS